MALISLSLVAGGSAFAATETVLPPSPAGSFVMASPLEADGPTADSSADSSATRALTIQKTCDTNANTGDGLTPPSVNGGVGPTNLVVLTNSHIAIYRKSDCSLVRDVTLKTFFSHFAIAGTETLFSPRVLYDPNAKRFVVTAQSSDTASNNRYLYFAVSKTTAGNSWFVYRITLIKGTTFSCNTQASSLPALSFPNLGRSAGRWFVTFDEGTSAGLILSIDKAPTLTGAALTSKCFDGTYPGTTPPIVLDSSTKAYFLSTALQSNGAVLWWFPLTIGAHASADKLGGVVFVGLGFNGSWISPPVAFQPNGQPLETNARFSSPSIQAGRFLWNVHTIQAADAQGNTFARWRLYKFSIGQQKAVFMFQPSTVAGDSTFNPSLVTTAAAATDPTASIYVTFTRTVNARKAIGRATMMVAKGPNGSKAGWSYAVVAESPSQFDTGSSGDCNFNANLHYCRWGSWSSIQMDPSDSTRAWAFNELVGTGPFADGSQWNWMTKGAVVK